MHFSIYVTNLGLYNEGYLVGEWVDLPCDDLESVYKRIGISDEPNEDGVHYEEMFITDYENDFGYKVDEYDSITKLNELAERIEDVAKHYGEDVIKAWIEAYSTGDDLEECLDDIEDGRVIFLGDIDADDYGRKLAECWLCTLPKGLQDEIERYFDFEEYGEDALQDYTETDYGYIYR